MSYQKVKHEINPYVKDHRCRSTPRYIRVLFGSQDIDVSDVSNIGLWQIWTTLALTYILSIYHIVTTSDK